jgi:phage-related protein
MIINATDFTFCNKKLSDFGFIIANFEHSAVEDTSCGNIEVITARPPMSDKNIIHGVNHGEPIKLIFQVVKTEPVTAAEYEEIMRWLVKPTYNYITFDNDIYFNVYINVVAKKICGQVYGFEITATNDSIYSYSKEYQTTISSTTTLTDESSVIGYTYPYFIAIRVQSDGDVVIKNESDTNRTTEIKNCIAGEKIIIDCENKIITSNSNSHNLSEDFNFVFFRLFNTENTRENVISVSDNIIVEMVYRFKRMVTV